MPGAERSETRANGMDEVVDGRSRGAAGASCRPARREERAARESERSEPEYAPRGAPAQAGRHRPRHRPRQYPPNRDRGSAMILTIAVMVLVTTLAGVGTTVAVRDLRGSGQAQQAGTALDAAEAGLAQAVSYIRTRGTRTLCSGCTANPWNPDSPVSADVPGGGHWSAWIAPVTVGPDPGAGTYTVHSTGTANGPAERTIAVDVTVVPIDLPKAVFGRTINLGGTVDLQQISILSTGCIYKRSKVSADHSAGLDAAYGVPVGVHSSQVITDSQGSGQYCSNTRKPIHDGLDLLGNSLLPCNTTYPYDQDRFGGSLYLLGVPLLGCEDSAIAPVYQQRDFDLDGDLDVNGSFIRDDSALFAAFGVTRPALTDAELERLRLRAQAQGSYYTSASGWTVPDGSVHPHSVLFFDLDADETVDLGPLDGSLWSRGRITDPASPLCIDASLLVVVQGGNARLNGNTELAAAVYLAGAAPGGELAKANGTADHIGMLYADTIDLTGNLRVSLDACYIANPPPALFDVNPGTYRELDR